MAVIRKLLIGLLTVVLISGHAPADAAAPDFNADRRVNIKCPSSIDKDRVAAQIFYVPVERCIHM